MARGPRKAKQLVDQITVKEDLIKNLEKQLKEEKEALKILKQAKSAQEIEKLQKFISISRMTPEQAIEILREHTSSVSEGAD